MWLAGSVCGQDSLGVITTHQEMKEVRKQRFIDRYENVFMTKEPTRHMVKVGIMPYNGWNGGYQYLAYTGNMMNVSAGYEYKVTPVFSVGAGGFFAGGIGSSVGEKGVRFSGTAGFSVQSRWYYEMKKRMESGYAASNFSGNYVGITYDHYFIWSGRGMRAEFSRVGAEWGMQRRFFNNGFVDLGAGLYYHFDGGGIRSNSTPETGETLAINYYKWGISSKATIGFAFGDWKKKTDLPFCEVLRCQEVVRSQFTILWPHLVLGLRYQSAAEGIGFEQKLSGSLSVKAQVDGFIFNQSDYVDDMKEHLFSAELLSAIQLRYYVSQRKSRKTGKGGYDLNGFYIGPLGEYSLSRTSNSYRGVYTAGTRDSLRGGIVTGYQRTLFKNAYVDVEWRMAWQLGMSSSYHSLSRINFGLRF